jgi:topoisomerase-4 subunit A
MGTLVTPPGDNGGFVEVVDLKGALEERYLAYALSTITQRALPDARDGMKPVHRRILFAMRQLRLDPGAAFKKSARVVGDVIGKYHPHGDQSVYDALVRLAQDFAQRWPMVEGQGNFGNVDGDNAAAMRYTEARMTEVARLLLEGLDEDAVDFRDTYDGSESEPVVLPGAFPNLLANGSQGIAVGMATSIPPHNVAEILDAALHIIEHPGAVTDDILHLVLGPDFPTGGVIVEPKHMIAEAYRTGRGGFRVRARWHKEETGRGTWVAVVTEIPYLIPKSRLIEKLAELVIEKKLPILADVRDESADDIRIVLEPRSRSIDPELLMASLFKLSELEARFPLNMNVLVNGRVPQVLGLAEAIRQWLSHRREVVVRRARFRLAAIEKRLEVLSGFLIAYLNIDEVIRIVREEDDPKAELMRRFELSEIQADAVLNIRLRALAKLEEFAIRKEHAALEAEKAGIDALLGSDRKQWSKVKSEIASVRKTFGPETPLGKRRSTFADAPDVALGDFTEAFVEREPLTVVVSEKGWIRTLKGHVKDLTTLTFKTGDNLKTAFFAETTSRRPWPRRADPPRH